MVVKQEHVEFLALRRSHQSESLDLEEFADSELCRRVFRCLAKPLYQTSAAATAQDVVNFGEDAGPVTAQAI